MGSHTWGIFYSYHCMPGYRINFLLVLNTLQLSFRYCCVHLSLKQSILQLHKGTVIKFVITINLISTRKCKTKISDKHKRCTIQPFVTAFGGKEWHGSCIWAVLLRYPRYYCGKGYKFDGITAVLGVKYAGIPWGWETGLQFCCGYEVGFTWTVNWCMNWGLCISKFQ